MASSEQEIVKMLQQKISEHEQKIQSLRQAMSALLGDKQDNIISARRGRKRGRKPLSATAKKSSVATKKKSGSKRQSGETFESIVLDLLSDGTPKTSRAVMDLYNKKTGRKLEVNGFSARLSILKKKGSIKGSKNSSDGLIYLTKA